MNVSQREATHIGLESETGVEETIYYTVAEKQT